MLEITGTVGLPAFKLGKYEVTVAEFRAFVEKAEHNPQGEGAHKLLELLKDQTKDRHPVVWVNRDDIAAYVDWLKETTGRNFRLPTVAEGAHTAGKEWNALGANLGSQGTSPVDSSLADRVGLCDLIGNVKEWQTKPDKNGNDGGTLFAVGAAYYDTVSDLDNLRKAGGQRYPWPYRNVGIGFRLAETLGNSP
jgi:formylglycine-generating enzyme required for sulfatase activity